MSENQKINPVLVVNVRGDIVESFHRGSFCVVNEEGNVIWEQGDIQQVSFPRSALKYFQHLPFLMSGGFDNLGFTDRELAIMCASHNGEKMHLEVVEYVLNQISLNGDALKCGAQQPTLKKDYIHLIQNHQEPTCMHNNCSGKHSGFLAHCVHEGLSVEDYLNANHPLHLAIKSFISLFYEIHESKLHLGVDGCSAPIFGMPLYNQALAYKNLVSPMPWKDIKLSTACDRIVKAVTDFPNLVGGTNRYCSDLMRITKGRILGKTGADGIYCLSIPKKNWGIAIKIDDGKMGPQYQVAHEILLRLNLLSTEESELLSKHGRFDNKNFAGKVVGTSFAVPLNCPF